MREEGKTKQAAQRLKVELKVTVRGIIILERGTKKWKWEKWRSKKKKKEKKRWRKNARGKNKTANFRLVNMFIYALATTNYKNESQGTAVQGVYMPLWSV